MSRYPQSGTNPPPPAYPYDRSLLAGAPSVTREERQAGYSVDVLERGFISPARTLTLPPPRPRINLDSPPIPSPNVNSDANPFDTPTDLLNKELYSHSAADTPSPVPPYRWYRTKRGTAIIVLVSLIVIAIIVGVAVGVSEDKKRRALLNVDHGAYPVSTDSSTDLTTDTTAFTQDPVVTTTSSDDDLTTDLPLSTTSSSSSSSSSSTTSIIQISTPAVTTASTTGTTTSSSSAAATSTGVPVGGGGVEPDDPEPSFWCKLFPFFC